jgi:hypothetical protein
MSKYKPLTTTEINGHPLLTEHMRSVCWDLVKIAKRDRTEFTMLDFARISLRATGNNYARITDHDDVSARVIADREHQHAALLYVYESLAAAETPIIAECTKDHETALLYLRLLADHEGLS